MVKSPWGRIIVFFLISAVFCGIFVKNMKIQESSVVMNLCGGTSQRFDYFSSDYKYNTNVQYPGGNTLSSVRYKPDSDKMNIGHRFDFGGIPDQTFLISSIILEKPGYKRYILDMSRANEWIKSMNQLKKPVVLDNNLLIKTSGVDGFFVTQDNVFDKFAKEEYNFSLRNFVKFLIAEIVLILFLMSYGRIAGGILFLSKKLYTKRTVISVLLFVGVNLFVIVPVFYFICYDISDTFIINMKSSKQSFIQLYHTYPYSEKKSVKGIYTNVNNFQSVKIPLPKMVKRENIRIDIGCDTADIEISSIGVQKYGFLLKCLDLKHADNIYSCSSHINKLQYRNGILFLSSCGVDPHIIPKSDRYLNSERWGVQFNNIFWTIIFCEFLLLLLLSETVRKMIRKISPVSLNTKENLLISASVAGAFVFVMCLSLPLQTFKMAEEIIIFKMNVLLKILCWFVPVSFVLLTTVLFGLNKRYGSIFSFIFASLTILFVLETGMLSFGLPELNGDFDAYHSVTRSLIHLTVWTVIVIVPLCFQKKIWQWLPWCVLAASVLSAAAMCDALFKKNPMQQNTGKLIVPATVNFDGTVDGVRYAEKNNVIVICLDAVSCEVAQKVLKDHPELKKHLSGFSFFSNNIGTNVSTMWAVPGIFTGKLSILDIPPAEFTTSVYSHDSALKKYLDLSYAVYIRVGLPRLSYLNPDCRTNLRPVTIFTPVEDSMLQWMFHELYSFKIAPFFLKEGLMKHYFYTVWPNRQKQNQADDSFLTSQNRDENYIYDKLSNAPLLDKKYPGAFHYHHFHGGHPPYKYDKDGNLVDRSKIFWQKDWTGYYERVYFEFKRVAKYFDSLKKRGLYDSSVIVLCADHGLETTQTGDSRMSKFKPMLMVKTKNSTAPFTEYKIPTSHTKISKFLKSDIFNVKQQDLPSVFHTEIRHILHNRVWQYTVDANKVIKSQRLKKSINNLNKIDIGFKYSLYLVSNDHFPPISFENLTEQINSLMLDGNSIGKITFKVPDPTALYTVLLEAALNPGTDRKMTVNIWSEHKTEKETFALGDQLVKLNNLKADKDGLITLCFMRNSTQGAFFIQTMKIDKQ